MFNCKTSEAEGNIRHPGNASFVAYYPPVLPASLATRLADFNKRKLEEPGSPFGVPSS